MVQSTAEPLSFGFAGAAHIRRVFTHQSGGPPLEAEKIPRQLPSGWGGLQAAPTPKPGTCSLLVYATMRNLAKKERLLECVRGCHASTLEILQLDVTDPLSLAAAAQQVPEQRVDVLGEPVWPGTSACPMLLDPAPASVPPPWARPGKGA